jgi:hypothetical protein
MQLGPVAPATAALILREAYRERLVERFADIRSTRD